MTDITWGIYYDSVADQDSGTVKRGDALTSHAPPTPITVASNLTKEQALSLYPPIQQ